MNELTLPNAMRQAIMNLVGGTTGLLSNSTMHLWKNAGVAINAQTILSAFTESTFQGYAAIAGTNPDSAYQDTLGNWHITFPSQQWTTVNGFQQTISNPVVGTITMTGTVTIAVTAAGMTGSPRTVTVNVFIGETPSIYGPRMAAAINADADTGPFFTASYAAGVLTLVAVTPVANDATMNAALADGTATGMTASPTSTQVQAGAAPVTINESAQGVYLTDSTGTQYRGAAAFPAPVGLTGPNQAVFAFPDLLYGS